MNPTKVVRERVLKLTDLPNIGPAGAADLRLLGIEQPTDLKGQCPAEMYRRLCALTGTAHDPCVMDVFMSVTAFMAGQEPRVWWRFTEERQRLLKNGAGEAS